MGGKTTKERMGDLRLACRNVGKVIRERVPAVRNLFQGSGQCILEINRSVKIDGHG